MAFDPEEAHHGVVEAQVACVEQLQEAARSAHSHVNAIFQHAHLRLPLARACERCRAERQLLRATDRALSNHVPICNAVVAACTLSVKVGFVTLGGENHTCIRIITLSSDGHAGSSSRTRRCSIYCTVCCHAHTVLPCVTRTCRC